MLKQINAPNEYPTPNSDLTNGIFESKLIPQIPWPKSTLEIVKPTRTPPRVIYPTLNSHHTDHALYRVMNL